VTVLRACVRCYLCDRLGADQVDHLVEVSDGASNDLSNLASCHAGCHERRHRHAQWAQERVEMALSVLGRAAWVPYSRSPAASRASPGFGKVDSSKIEPSSTVHRWPFLISIVALLPLGWARTFTKTTT
jgi:HNH endonuclease